MYIREVLRSYGDIRSKPADKRTEVECRCAVVVETALAQVDNAACIAMINMVYFDKTHTIEGAALEIPVSRGTAMRWNGDFMRIMADTMHLV